MLIMQVAGVQHYVQRQRHVPVQALAQQLSNAILVELLLPSIEPICYICSQLAGCDSACS